jgi:hypothetical protein
MIGSIINPRFIKAFAEKKLIIDCPHIRLTQNKEKDPEIYEGPGLIARLGTSNFDLRMYPTSHPNSDSPFDKWFSQQFGSLSPGTIIPNDHYFSLEATDLQGTVWRNSAVSPNLTSGAAGTVLTANLDVINAATDIEVTASSALKLHFFDELKLPYNRTTQVETTVENRTVSSSFSRDRAEFDIAFMHYIVKKVLPEEGDIVMFVSSHDGDLQSGLENRIQEALRFVTFSDVSWCICERAGGGKLEISVTTSREATTGFLRPPLRARSEFFNNYWSMFSAYLLHVTTNHNVGEYHPLTQQLNPLLTSHSVGLQTIELLLGVAVEGVLKAEFGSLAAPNAELLESIKNTQKIVKRVRCADERLKSRVRGLIGSMNTSRAKDKLKLLENAKAITTDMVEAWDKLRNSSAHAVHPRADELQGSLNKIMKVYSLLITLVLIAISYKGKYQRFDLEGWPEMELTFDSASLTLCDAAEGE